MNFSSLLAELLVKQAPKTITASAQGTLVSCKSIDGRFFGNVVVDGQTVVASLPQEVPAGVQCLVSIHKALEAITRKDGTIVAKDTVWCTAVPQA